MSNPFATRFVHPGATPYVFPSGQSPRSLIDKLSSCGWRAAIVGRHGTGKTTLVHTLMPHIIAAGKEPIMVVLHDGACSMPFARGDWRALDRKTLLIIDGYEQLSRRSRGRLWLNQKLRGFGLLVTAHTDLRLPAIFRTRGDLAVLRELVEQSLPPHGGIILPTDIECAFMRRNGDIREALFDLYDLFEWRRTRT